MIRPILNNVLVKPYPSDDKSEGGIIVSEAHRAISQKMKVIAVGSGTKKHPMNFKVGDTAFRVKDCGDEVLVNGERHFIVKSNWLIAKMK